MRPQRQSGQAHPRTKAASSGITQNLLEICAQLTNSSADPAAFLETIAASARQIFRASAAGMLVKDGEAFVLKGRVAQPPSAVSPDVRVAQPPGSPTRAGVARGGVEVPSAATEGSSQEDKVFEQKRGVKLWQLQILAILAMATGSSWPSLQSDPGLFPGFRGSWRC